MRTQSAVKFLLGIILGIAATALAFALVPGREAKPAPAQEAPDSLTQSKPRSIPAPESVSNTPPTTPQKKSSPEELKRWDEKVARLNKRAEDYPVLYPESMGLKRLQGINYSKASADVYFLGQKYPEFFKAHGGELDDIIFLGKRCRQGAIICSWLDSDTLVARATLGEVLTDLSTNGDLLPTLQKEVSSAAVALLGDTDLSTKVNNARSLAELRDILQSAQPRFENYFRSHSALLSANEEIKSAVEAQINTFPYETIEKSYDRLYPVFPKELLDQK